LKCHYLAAFTAAMLNNQPMGFYSPATLVKDAQRHGLRMRPIDVTCSDRLCKIEKVGEELSVRLGMRYVRGLRGEIADEIVRERDARAFTSLDDLKLRVPVIRKAELTALAEIGALNFIGGARGGHRRDALWQVERAARSAGPLLERCEQTDRAASAEQEVADSATTTMAKTTSMEKATSAETWTTNSPLQQMTPEERLVADFRGTGMTVGPHPMKYHRASMKRQGILTASELNRLPDGTHVRVAGGVIARQRPGTAKGFVFLSIEDETGIANAIVTPRVFEEHRVTIVHQQFLLIEGQLQHQDNVVSVKVESVQALSVTRAETTSHDFH
jgi:error-prone DNA polymerase